MEITFIKDKIRMDAGGGSWSLHLLAENLSQRGHNIKIVTVHFGGLDNNITEHHTYEVVERPVKNRMQADAAAQTYRVLDDISQPDILHCFQPELHAVVGAWSKRAQSLTTVGQINSYESFCTNHSMIDNECYKNCTLQKKWEHHPDPSITDVPKMAFDTWLQPNLMNDLNLLIPVSPTVKEIFSGYGIEETKLSIHPPMYNKNFGEFKIHEHDYRLLYVGRLVEKKGISLLLDAIKQIDIDLTVDIVGTGPQLEYIKKRAGDNVNVHGWVNREDLPRFYEQAHVFVHPGIWPEPFGITILEAMQCGCVPLVSNVGGPPWIAGEAGVTFERGSSDDLATRIEHLSSEEIRKEYIENIPQELERFDTENTVNKYEQTYMELFE